LLKADIRRKILNININIEVKFGKNRGVTDPISETDAVGTSTARGFTIKIKARDAMANPAPIYMSIRLFIKRSS